MINEKEPAKHAESYLNNIEYKVNFSSEEIHSAFVAGYREAEKLSSEANELNEYLADKVSKLQSSNKKLAEALENLIASCLCGNFCNGIEYVGAKEALAKIRGTL